MGQRFETYKKRQTEVDKLFATADIDETFAEIVRIMTIQEPADARERMHELARMVGLKYFGGKRTQREFGWFVGYLITSLSLMLAARKNGLDTKAPADH